MGACTIGGTYTAYDLWKGIQKIQDDYEREYGFQEGYSGGPNCVDFSYRGDKSKLTKKQLNEYVRDRMDNILKRDGEIVKVGTEGYTVFKTKYVKQKNPSKSWLRNRKPGAAATLIRYDDWGHKRVIADGKVTDLKKKAHEILRKEFYECQLELVTRDSVYICEGERKHYKKTSRQTDDKVLVAELGKYRYYGWAPE